MVETIISLTTIPPRFGGITPVLSSLLAQGGDRVVLALPRTWARFPDETGAPDVPEGVHLLPCEDLGPASKVLPVRARWPKADILYCDDDCLYGPGWLHALTAGSDVRAGSCFDVARLRREGDVVAQGFAGVRVPASVPLPDHVPDVMRDADDLWLSGWMVAHGATITPVPEARNCVQPLHVPAGLQETNRAETYAAAADAIHRRFGIWPAMVTRGDASAQKT